MAEGEGNDGGVCVDRSTTLAGGKWCTHRASASTVRDQMTRASAHNNCLFTLRSYPIPASNPVALRVFDDQGSTGSLVAGEHGSRGLFLRSSLFTEGGGRSFFEWIYASRVVARALLADKREAGY